MKRLGTVYWGGGRSATLADLGDRRPTLEVQLAGHAAMRLQQPQGRFDVVLYHPGPDDNYRYLLGVFVEPPTVVSFRTEPVAAIVVDRFLFAVVDRGADRMTIDVDGRPVGAMLEPGAETEPAPTAR